MKPLFTLKNYQDDGSPQGFGKVTFTYKRKHKVEIYPFVEFDPGPWSYLQVVIDDEPTEDEDECEDEWCEYGYRPQHALYCAASGSDLNFHRVLKLIIERHIALSKEEDK